MQICGKITGLVFKTYIYIYIYIKHYLKTIGTIYVEGEGEKEKEAVRERDLYTIV
jgi:hypothetical protein